MVTTEPNVLDWGKYNAKKTCEALGVSRPTLYKFVRLGILKPTYTDNRKFYYGSDIKNCWRMY